MVKIYARTLSEKPNVYFENLCPIDVLENKEMIDVISCHIDGRLFREAKKHAV